MKHKVNILCWLPWGILLLVVKIVPVTPSAEGQSVNCKSCVIRLYNDCCAEQSLSKVDHRDSGANETVSKLEEIDLVGKCTDIRSGVPACDFNRGNMCGWKEITKDIADYSWQLTSGANDGPVIGYDDAYIFLDPARSNEKAIKLEGTITNGVKAMCVNFSYATSGPVHDPIRFLLWDGEDYHLIQEFYPDTDNSEIYTKWHSGSFECCLPQTQSGNKMLTLEAKSVNGAAVAIDYIDARVSYMTCTGDTLVCNSQLTTHEPAFVETTAIPTTVEVADTTTVATTTKSPPAFSKRTTTQEEEEADTTTAALVPYEPTCPGAEEDRMGSCYFQLFQRGSDLCGWQTSSESELIRDDDGEGNYIFFPAGLKEDFYHEIDDEVESICMDIRFSADNVGDIGCVPLFKIYLSNEREGDLWGENYDHCGLKEYEWRVNSFDGCLGYGSGRKLTLQTGGRVGLKIAHIRIRKTDIKCSVSKTTEKQVPQTVATKPVPTETQVTEIFLTKPLSPTEPTSHIKPKSPVLLSCNVESPAEFCGFTPSSVSKEESRVYWEEIYSQPNVKIFEGKDRYMLVSGKSETLQEPATLRSRIVETLYTSTLKFSYNMVGNVWLHVKLQPVGGTPARLIWKSNKETSLIWKDVKVAIKTAGRYEIIFKVYSNYVGVDSSETIRFGLADISLEESTDYPDALTPETVGKNITVVEAVGGGKKHVLITSKSKSSTIISTLGVYGFNVFALIGIGFGTLALFALMGVGIWLYKQRTRTYGRLIYNYHNNGGEHPQPASLERVRASFKP